MTESDQHKSDASIEASSSTTSPEPAAEVRESRFVTPSSEMKRELRSQKLLMLVVRSLFLVLLVVVSVATLMSEGTRFEDFDPGTFFTVVIVAFAIGLFVLFLDAILPTKRLTSVVGVYLGICAGLLLALAVGALIDVMADAWDLTGGRMDVYRGLAKVIIAIVLCYLSVSVVLTTKDDFRLVIPYVEFSKQVRGIRPLLVDTSVLIDGRVESLGNTGFIDAPLIVPQFVIDELQQLADSSDKLKRARGRRGLNMLTKLQESPFLDLSLDTTQMTGRSVDHMLLDMAKEQNLRILTTDYNLNKVAQIQGVSVLNINDLANAVKSTAMPGETMSIEIIKAGESPTQGVGYMPDGTMVVVEHAADHIGHSVMLTVTNSLQTSAGRMIFGRMIGEHEDGQRIAHSATHQQRATSPPKPSESTRTSRNPRR
jgi:uncharacterized protein YacL